MIAVLGAAGGVGRTAATQLYRWGLTDLRLGGRRAAPVEELAASLPGTVAHAGDLDAFCAGADVVLNCAGPATELGDRVARAALAAGADYVDAAGDDLLYDQVAAALGSDPRRTAVVSAGLMPGLTALLPRYLRALLPGARRLTGHIGGRDRFTHAAAVDYLAVGGGFGEPLAAWRDGAQVPRALAPAASVAVPFFDEPVTVQPYLSTETARLAVRLGLTDVDWYSVFAGHRVLGALRRADSAEELRRAADLDAFGHPTYQLLVLEASGPDGTRVLALRGGGASALTGLFAAATARAVARGEVPAGAHHAGEILDPAATVELLRTAPAVEYLTVAESGDHVEETL